LTNRTVDVSITIVVRNGKATKARSTKKYQLQRGRRNVKLEFRPMRPMIFEN